MTKYHISPETGRPNICRAKIKCPIGGDSEHYSTKEEARAGFEKTMKNQTFSKGLSKIDQEILKTAKARVQSARDLWAGGADSSKQAERYSDYYQKMKAELEALQRGDEDAFAKARAERENNIAAKAKYAEEESAKAQETKMSEEDVKILTQAKADVIRWRKIIEKGVPDRDKAKYAADALKKAEARLAQFENGDRSAFAVARSIRESNRSESKGLRPAPMITKRTDEKLLPSDAALDFERNILEKGPFKGRKLRFVLRGYEIDEDLLKIQEENGTFQILIASRDGAPTGISTDLVRQELGYAQRTIGVRKTIAERRASEKAKTTEASKSSKTQASSVKKLPIIPGVPPVPSKSDLDNELNSLQDELYGDNVKDLLQYRNIGIREIEEAEKNGEYMIDTKVPSYYEIAFSTDLARRELGLPPRPETGIDQTPLRMAQVAYNEAYYSRMGRLMTAEESVASQKRIDETKKAYEKIRDEERAKRDADKKK